MSEKGHNKEGAKYYKQLDLKRDRKKQKVRVAHIITSKWDDGEEGFDDIIYVEEEI